MLTFKEQLEEILREDYPKYYNYLLKSNELEQFLEDRNDILASRMSYGMKSGLNPDQAREIAWEEAIAISSPTTDPDNEEMLSWVDELVPGQSVWDEIQNEIKQEERSERRKALLGKFLSILGWILFFPIFTVATFTGKYIGYELIFLILRYYTEFVLPYAAEFQGVIGRPPEVENYYIGYVILIGFREYLVTFFSIFIVDWLIRINKELAIKLGYALALSLFIIGTILSFYLYPVSISEDGFWPVMGEVGIVISQLIGVVAGIITWHE